MPDYQEWGTPPNIGYVCATRIWGRYPEFKLHKNIGQAKNAIAQKCQQANFTAEVWELDENNAWTLKWEFDGPVNRNNLPWVDTAAVLEAERQRQEADTKREIKALEQQLARLRDNRG